MQPSFMFNGDTSGVFSTVYWVILNSASDSGENSFSRTLLAPISGSQAFHVFPNHKEAQTLRIWHTGVVGFATHYKHELTDLRELKQKESGNWESLFEKVKGVRHSNGRR